MASSRYLHLATLIISILLSFNAYSAIQYLNYDGQTLVFNPTKITKECAGHYVYYRVPLFVSEKSFIYAEKDTITNAVRTAIHLPRQVITTNDPIFYKELQNHHKNVVLTRIS